jgi:hypothetical protein
MKRNIKMKTFKTINELIESLDIADIKQYLFDLVDDKFIVTSSDERAQFYIELSITTNADNSISVDNLKFREFKKQLEMAKMIHTILSLSDDDSSIYEIWVLNGNSFSIKFKPDVTEGAVKTVINSLMLVQFDGDNMNLTFNAIVNAKNGKDDLIDWVFNGDKKGFNIVNLTVREINDKISNFTALEAEELKANVEIIKRLLNREPSDPTD